MSLGFACSVTSMHVSTLGIYLGYLPWVPAHVSIDLSTKLHVQNGCGRLAVRLCDDA